MVSSKTTIVSIRVPHTIASRLNALAAKNKMSRNDYAKRALQRYMGLTLEGQARSHKKKS